MSVPESSATSSSETQSSESATRSVGGRGEVRQKALQEELRELVGVVGPGPLVDLLLERSFELGATDVHFDPRPDGLHVRLRVDGILHDVLVLEQQVSPQVISRLKLMAGMDITERRFAQDGHISSSVLRHQRDVRVGSGPTIYGERLVLRLMPDSSNYVELDQLGLEPDQTELVLKGIHAPYGMVLSVGPVGSGKSTTTYSCLSLLNDPGRSLVTIEDPVERRIDGVNQIQVDSKINFGFVEALRGVLRQDPDVMMVGEIRDPETAHIAARAGLTGVRVLSTLHANDTASTIDVFREFGIPPMFIADSVNCIIAQRLLRKVCPNHRETFRPDPATAQVLGLNPEDMADVTLARGIPADSNFHTGYFGRTGVFEVLYIDDAIREAILDEKSGTELGHLARKEGMTTLEQSAIRKVLAGVTSIEEMHRVLTS
ncbi:Putative type II secretion system protein E [Maioricimonas rarisocia]|uniref:Type II secretion system protein E n=1 Tax=Maioricimonas rarisocia TaxID=2528026 RepID=A0A517Z2U7_9PLAN|nr:GspE/PulE family protein [Maioricimonas rarisocia]QDU36766.1 Putative type II secretion system protein E [Maioricimonas rarisocia]